MAVIVKKPTAQDDQASPAPEKGSKDRSPSFPFIPLQTAIQRLEAFEKYFGRHPAPATKVGLAWGMKEKSSQADQTLAALRSYGLLKYEGMGAARQAQLTEEGRNYLRTQQDSVRVAILKQSALRPKIIRHFWAIWGQDRPPDAVALDQLYDGKFSDAGAANFLKVYDDTIAFAGLSDSDEGSPSPSGPEEDDELEAPALTPQVHTPSKPTPPPPIKLGHQHAIFPLAEGEVSLSFPAELSLASAKTMASFVKLLVEQAEQQAKAREASVDWDKPENDPKDEAAN